MARKRPEKKGGRKRYIKLAEARQFAQDNPELAVGRRRRQRAMDGKQNEEENLPDESEKENDAS
jgi:hypothetical protein